MTNPLYTYLLSIHIDILLTYFVDNIFNRAWALFFLAQLNGFMLQYNISHNLISVDR